jgi:hypothetical protein
MRCYCCDNLLTPEEATRKWKASGMFTDMCNKCLREISGDTDPFLATVEGSPEEGDLFDEEGNPKDEYEDD